MVTQPSVRTPTGSFTRPVLRQKQKETIAFYLFASPWILGFVFFSLIPILASIYFSFTEYDIITPAKWIGLDNYVAALWGGRHELFILSLKITTVYAITSVPLQMVGGFLTALLMNQNVRGIYAFRVIYYLPAVTSGIANAILWKFVFSQNYGILNYFLTIIGLEPIPWLASTKWALPSLVIMSMWGFGGAMIIYIAGFRSIPEQLYEAAQLDGAGVMARFLNITIPMMSPVIFFNLIMGIIGSFQVFTNAFAMTGGGPGRATYFYMLYLYHMAFRDFNMGYASALAWILFVIIGVLTFISFRAAGSLVYYEAGPVK